MKVNLDVGYFEHLWQNTLLFGHLSTELKELSLMLPTTANICLEISTEQTDPSNILD